jgi:hypothetical protein
MATSIPLLIGAVTCVAFILGARTTNPRRELIIYAVGLVFAAMVYVGFAIVGGASWSWLGLEVAGVVVFASVALVGLRVSVWAISIGWAAHTAWDVLLHGVQEAAFVPEWYPVFCIGFDLVLAGYVAVRKR